jgi:hypothetical protein
MNDRTNKRDRRFKVAVRAREGGRYNYEIFTVAAEPQTLQGEDKTYASPQEAERAGYEALAVLISDGGDTLRGAGDQPGMVV